MQVTKQTPTPTTVKLSISAEPVELEQVKTDVLTRLANTVKLQGFRPGKAPLNLVEKSLDPNQLQTEFLEQAVNALYVYAVDSEKVRPVSQPQISIVKFVPFSTLEITAEVESVGDVTLPNYGGLKVERQPVTVTAAQVDDVIKSLQTRAATREDVTRAAKLGDEATIDFKGVDAKTKEPIVGADGNDYALVLGSGNFIPGFEEEVVGLKPGAEKSFDITFPADYGAVSLQKKKVTFSITVKKLQALKEPELDADFAAQIGPFKSVDELKKDIRRELENQAQNDSDRKYENDLVEAVAKKTKVDIPAALVDEELNRLEEQERQNVVYRGQTWQEHLDEEGVTEQEHRERNREGAEVRVKAGLVLGELADVENISVTPEELEIRLQLLRGQYATDERMQAELEKPENRRDIMNRMLTEKTLDKLKTLNS